MTFTLLLELQEITTSDTTSVDSPEIKKCMHSINRIAQLLFSRDAGAVKDLKRSKEAIFTGVSHVKSRLVGVNKKPVTLTFDNSTDSTEFEINSLTPMMIAKGSDRDKAIRKLYSTYEVKSKKYTNYIEIDDQVVLREIHLGKHPHKHTVKLVKHLLFILRDGKKEESEPDDQESKPVEKEPIVKPKEEVKKKLPFEVKPSEDKKLSFKQKVKEELTQSISRIDMRANADNKSNISSAETAIEFTELKVATKLSLTVKGGWSVDFELHPKQVLKKGTFLYFIKRIDGFCEYKTGEVNERIRIGEAEVEKLISDGALLAIK